MVSSVTSSLRASARRNAAAAALGLALALAAGSGVARAQLFFPPAAFGLSPDDVSHMVTARGYRLLAQPYQNGSVYVVDAVDSRGVQERLIVDAYRGEIVRRFLVARPAPRYVQPDAPNWPRDAASSDERPQRDQRYMLEEGAPRPPQAIPNRPTYSDNELNFPPGRDDSTDTQAQPNVVTGVPEATKPKPKHVAKPKPEKQIVRATPLPPPDKAVAPPPGPSAPAAPSAATPAPAPAAGATPPASAAQPTAPTPPTPQAKPATDVAAAPAPQPPAPAPVVKKPKPEKPAVPTGGQFNDVPPAPLD